MDIKRPEKVEPVTIKLAKAISSGTTIETLLELCGGDPTTLTECLKNLSTKRSLAPKIKKEVLDIQNEISRRAALKKQRPRKSRRRR